MELFYPVKPTVLIVDDSPVNLALIASLLDQQYTVKAVNHGAKALTMVSESPPDLILLDIFMPDLDGFEVCRRLKADPLTSHIPVIFLTSKRDIDSEKMGMDLGAVDYVNRPISPLLLLSRVRAHLVDASHAHTLQLNNEYLEYEVGKRASQLVALQDITIFAMASLAETRDNETGNHLRRTQNYVRALGNYLKDHPRFSRSLSADMVLTLYKCAPLHDIGKVGIPDYILRKPGQFTPEEFGIMKTHPALGREAILNALLSAGEPLDFLETAMEIVYSHHEKWDGSGYPQGLAGDAIPVSARLMALADVYDALISERVYKKGMPHTAAVEIIVQGRGTHFDADVVDAFLNLSAEFQSIATQFADSQSGLMQSKGHFASHH